MQRVPVRHTLVSQLIRVVVLVQTELIYSGVGRAIFSTADSIRKRAILKSSQTGCSACRADNLPVG